MQASVARPRRDLKAFAKVSLEPREIAPVTLVLGGRELSVRSTAHGWVVEGGDFDIAVGTSSRDLRLTRRIHNAAPLTGPVGLM